MSTPYDGCFRRVTPCLGPTTRYPDFDRATTGQVLTDGVTFRFLRSGRIVGHSESVAGTASGRGDRLCRGRYSLLSVATNGSPAFALRSWSLISPRLEAADDAFDHREDELNVDDRRFGLS